MVSNIVSRINLNKNRFFEIYFYISFVVLVIFFLSKMMPESMYISGGCVDESSPYMLSYYDDDREISFCNNGDNDIKKIETPYFKSGEMISFLYSGYPQNTQIDVRLEAKSGKSINLDLQDAREGWKSYLLRIPEDFQNEMIRVVADDGAHGAFGWVGLGLVQSEKFGFSLKALIEIVLLILLIHFAFVIGLTVFLEKYSVGIAVVFFVLSLGSIGILSFWASYLNPVLGYVLSFILIVVLLYSLYRLVKLKIFVHLIESNKLMLPVSSLALFILIIGLYPYFTFDWMTPANRWLNLPIDNWLPKIFADQVWREKVMTPMLGDWLSSDRPPLQVGLVLLWYPLFDDSNLFYQVFSSWLQALVLLPIILILRDVNYKLVVWGVLAVSLTSLIVVHTLFVWPKLLSLSFLLVGFYLLYQQGEFNKKFCVIRSIAIGLTFSLAMLSHGGAVFAIVTLMIIYAVKGEINRLKTRILNGVLISFTFVLFYLPWLIYQKWIDPPGDRLVKWHLAGMIDANNLSLVTSFKQAYQDMSLVQFIEIKIANLKTIFGGTETFLIKFFDGAPIVGDSFFHTFISYWWFSPVFALIVWFLLSGYHRSFRMTNELLLMLATGVLTLFLWSLLMFVPGSTTIHQGTFFSWMILFLFSLGLVWQTSKMIFFVFLILNIVLFVNNYVIWQSGEEVFYMLAALSFMILLGSIWLLKGSQFLTLEEKNRG